MIILFFLPLDMALGVPCTAMLHIALVSVLNGTFKAIERAQKTAS